MSWHQQHRDDERIIDRLDTIIRLLHKVLNIESTPTGVSIHIIGGSMPSVNAGSSITFEGDPTPAGSLFPSGTVMTWIVDDPATSLAPNANQVTASVPATDTNASFNLAVSVQMPTPAGGVAPAPLTNTVNVTINQAAAALPTGVAINEVTPAPAGPGGTPAARSQFRTR